MSDLPFVTELADRRSAGVTRQTREVIQAFATAFYLDRDIRGAFESWVAEDYIQHNPKIADGRAAAIEALGKFTDPQNHFDIRRVLVDGPYAVIQLRAWRGEDRGGVVMDMYRVEGSRVVEHWDVIQDFPTESRNDHPLI